jgi:hypothetical protein
MAHTKLQLAKDLEHVIEQNLMAKEDFTLRKFRDAREQIAGSPYDYQGATLPTGEIIAAAELARPATN